MKFLPKILIANFALLLSASAFADYNTNYTSPIHSNGRMPDGTTVYDQGMTNAPATQHWIYDPAVSSSWRPHNGEPQPSSSSYTTDVPSNLPTPPQGQMDYSHGQPGNQNQPLSWSHDRDFRGYDQR